MPGGNVGTDVIVDLASHLTRIEAPDVDSGTIRVQAGAVAADVMRRAESAGFTFPALPSSAWWCTIGGMIANNAAGARSFKYGSVRRAVRALDVVLPDGTALHLSRDRNSGDLRSLLERAGLETGDGRRTAGVPPRTANAASAPLPSWPAVRKNSSGYGLDWYLESRDPIDLFIGAEGTLGIITGATLDLWRDPDSRALVLLRARDAADLAALTGGAHSADASACEFFGSRFLEVAELADDPELEPFTRSAYALVLVEMDGTPSEVADGLRMFERIAKSLHSPLRIALSLPERNRLWALRHAASPIVARQAERGLISMQFIEDSVVPVERFPAYLAEVQDILRRQDMDAVIFGHAGDANAHINPLVNVGFNDWRERVRRVLEDTAGLVSELGGTLSGEHGDGRVRAPFLSRIWGEPTVERFRALKDAFDPLCIMNPGVILPLEGQDPLAGIGVRFPER